MQLHRLIILFIFLYSTVIMSQSVPGIILYILLIVNATAQDSYITHLTGVYKGQTLFVQNTFDPEQKKFCISAIKVNSRAIAFNQRSSAIKLDFEGIDMYTPVNITILHNDSLCIPIVINPDAISFHSTFSFKELALSDSSMVWKTVGDKADAVYAVEKYKGGIWLELDTIAAQGRFEGASYQYFPPFEEGANKFRVKYIYPDGHYLYSWELEFHYYPNPVTFKPAVASDLLYLSRASSYDIYDAGSKLVLSGRGIIIDVSLLPSGDYVVYFDGKDPGVFKKR